MIPLPGDDNRPTVPKHTWGLVGGWLFAGSDADPVRGPEDAPGQPARSVPNEDEDDS